MGVPGGARGGNGCGHSRRVIQDIDEGRSNAEPSGVAHS